MERKASEFTRNECRKIAISYATSIDDLSASYYARLYNTSTTVIYSIIDRAVIESMIAENVISLIVAKSGRNASMHGGEHGRKQSYDKYKRLMERRANFEFTRATKEYYTIEYVNSDEVIDMKVFADINCMTTKLLQKTLVSAVVDNIVSEEIVDKLYKKALQHNPSWKVVRLFKNLRRQRQENLAEKKARQKERRLKNNWQKEEDEIRAMLDAILLNPDDAEKRKHLEFIQMGIADYGIPGEMEEQMASFTSSEGKMDESEDDEMISVNAELDANQMSFFEN